MAPIVRIQRSASHQKFSVAYDICPISTVWTYSDIMRAIETIQTIMWKPGLTKYKSISMVFISTFQIYFYETRSSAQSLRMQFFRSDPLDVFNLVDEDRSFSFQTFLFYITDLR